MRKHKILIIAGILFILTICLPTQVLYLTGGNDGENIYLIHTKDIITFEFLHSMYNVTQREMFIPNNSELILSEEYFGSLEAALYYNSVPQYPMEKREDGFYITELDIPFRSVHYAIAHGTDYSIKFNNNEIDLNEHFPNDVFIEMRTDKIIFGKYLVWRIGKWI